MCPHCGSSYPPRIDKDWLYFCPKCGRGELRPLPVEVPLERALLFPKKPPAVERKKEEPRLSMCPDCGVEFMTKAHHPVPRCPVCRKERKRRRMKKWYEENRKKSRLGTTAGAESRGGVKC